MRFTKTRVNSCENFSFDLGNDGHHVQNYFEPSEVGGSAIYPENHQLPPCLSSMDLMHSDISFEDKSEYAVDEDDRLGIQIQTLAPSTEFEASQEDAKEVHNYFSIHPPIFSYFPKKFCKEISSTYSADLCYNDLTLFDHIGIMHVEAKIISDLVFDPGGIYCTEHLLLYNLTACKMSSTYLRKCLMNCTQELRAYVISSSKPLFTRYAPIDQAKAVGLILVSPICRAPSWTEWLNKILKKLLYFYCMCTAHKTCYMEHYLKNQNFYKIEIGIINQSPSAFNRLIEDIVIIKYWFQALIGFSSVINWLGQFDDILDSSCIFNSHSTTSTDICVTHKSLKHYFSLESNELLPPTGCEIFLGKIVDDFITEVQSLRQWKIAIYEVTLKNMSSLLITYFRAKTSESSKKVIVLDKILTLPFDPGGFTSYLEISTGAAILIVVHASYFLVKPSNMMPFWGVEVLVALFCFICSRKVIFIHKRLDEAHGKIYPDIHSRIERTDSLMTGNLWVRDPQIITPSDISFHVQGDLVALMVSATLYTICCTLQKLRIVGDRKYAVHWASKVQLSRIFSLIHLAGCYSSIDWGKESQHILNKCRSQTAIIWYRLCHVTYSFHMLIPRRFHTANFLKVSTQEKNLSSNPERFSKVLMMNLMNNLSNAVAFSPDKNMFASVNIDFFQKTTICGLVQYTRDIFDTSCYNGSSSALEDKEARGIYIFYYINFAQSTTPSQIYFGDEHSENFFSLRKGKSEIVLICLILVQRMGTSEVDHNFISIACVWLAFFAAQGSYLCQMLGICQIPMGSLWDALSEFQQHYPSFDLEDKVLIKEGGSVMQISKSPFVGPVQYGPNHTAYEMGAD
ncbi:cysteine-rich receptor-like protein kinase 15 [Senna tora]|uniref:Cysteine-rich receptor-like protein kinase 15 n=1 Tax=Senna tora TaxID=362788 RepID=A0A834VZ30_9FABA|nr:cysteine-rich receptor-like protein kinase 15 [Senna tora]